MAGDDRRMACKSSPIKVLDETNANEMDAMETVARWISAHGSMRKRMPEAWVERLALMTSFIHPVARPVPGKLPTVETGRRLPCPRC